MRLVQLQSPAGDHRAGLVEDNKIRLLERVESIYDLAIAASSLAKSVNDKLSRETLDYESIYQLQSDWRILVPFTHPEPARCLVSGTGLTHKASAKNRDAMHAKREDLSDSMKMYLSGLEGGRPEPGTIGVAPEWFYKGNGTILRAHGEPLLTPAYAEDGGEEPEIAGVYLIDKDGQPRRVGMTMANEFSDHRLEKQNYLYLAPSKLRNCSIGPELIVDPDFSDVPGSVRIERGGQTLWSQSIHSGEANMAHSLANLEHHHFKFDEHRRPGDIHIHFFGADAFSFGAGIELQDRDIMEVAFEGFGKPLRNPVRIDRSPAPLIAVTSL
jgi:hypothetical protein